MKYYLHDSNSFNDEKITELFINFGYEGLGLFYTLLEKIALQEKPIKTPILKHQLKVGKRLSKCWEFMEEIELIYSLDGETFNEQLLKFSEKYQIKKEKNRKRISEWRENKEVSKNVTRNNVVSNTPKVNISKVNISKDKNIEEQPVFNFKKSLLNLGIETQIVSDWLKVRRSKKATNSQTALNSIIKEIKTSGKSANECITLAVENSWAGFKAEWLNKQTNEKTRTNNRTGFNSDTTRGAIEYIESKFK